MTVPGDDYDVIVVGGGPAGSTVATLAAKAGHRVLVLEKRRFPRYQIGESLLLETWSIFSRLGIKRRIAGAGFQRKPGATFLWGETDTPWTIYFAELNGRQRDSRNVERGRFDQILLDRAQEAGGEVRFDASAIELLWEDERVVGVRVKQSDRPVDLRSRLTVDASGRDSKLTERVVSRFRPDQFRGAAIWTYYRGVRRLAPPQTGNILYAMFHWGWFWVIPLSDGIESVGIVVQPEKFFEARGRVKGREALFTQAIEACPMIADMLQNARRVDGFHACSDFSRNAQQYFRPGLFIVGDSACFIDPILSTGIHLAMRGGLLAGLAANTILAGGEEMRAMRTFDDLYRRDYEPLLKVSQLQYEMNRNVEERFWLAHRILDPSRESRDQLADRQAYIKLIAGMGAADQERLVKAHRVHQLERFRRHGLGRYDGGGFGDAILVPTKSPMLFEPGYREGGRRRLTFASARLTENSKGARHVVGTWDARLLRLCDGKQPVRSIVGELSRAHSLTAADATTLRRMLGYWVDNHVLLRANA